MSNAIPNDTDLAALREFPIGDRLSAYITALTQNAAGSFVFRTGAGRILRDLLLHWPLLENWEIEAQELCNRATEAVYPLVAALYAQGVEITVTIAASPIAPPDRINALSTYVVFDCQSKQERHCFLSPERTMPPLSYLSTAQGVVILCRPLNLRYHTIQDDRKRGQHPGSGIFELSQRLINELYTRPDFVPQQKVMLDRIQTKIHELPKMIEENEAAKATNLPAHAKTPQHEPVLKADTALSALPPPARALAHLLIGLSMGTKLPAGLRLQLRKIAQMLRMGFPQALLEETAQAETASPHAAPSLHVDATTPRQHPPAKVTFPTPSPEPFPHTPTIKGRR